MSAPNLRIEKTPLQGLLVLHSQGFKDDRGFFIERFQEEKFAHLGIQNRFLQDNHSRSLPGVLRGLHFQYDPPQAKLIGVLSGKIWDVAVDLRPHSPTFKKHFALELDGESGKLLFIPFGFAHGFVVLGDEPADVLYTVDAFYNPQTECGILWNDPELNLPWPITKPKLSARDLSLPSFHTVTRERKAELSQVSL